MTAPSRKIPVMLALAMLLQEATNRLFMRRFTVALGVLKDRGPAVILSTHRTFGKSQRLLMDIRSFLDMCRDMSGVDDRALEKKGYVIGKKDKMDVDFHIPSWAFPRALLECLIAAEEIAASFKGLQESLDKMLDLMRSSGIAEEEVQKFKDRIINPQKEKTTIH